MTRRQLSARRRPPRGPNGAEPAVHGGGITATATTAVAGGVNGVSSASSSSSSIGSSARPPGSQPSVDGDERGGRLVERDREGVHVAQETQERGTLESAKGTLVDATRAATVDDIPVHATLDCRRVWEVQASEALSAREKGLLPNGHPVQHAFLQVGVHMVACVWVGTTSRKVSRNVAVDILRLISDSLFSFMRSPCTSCLLINISSPKTSTNQGVVHRSQKPLCTARTKTSYARCSVLH